jgi:catechol 2,3-dioxygenase-like lactoylglutathione lyase family enzyme
MTRQATNGPRSSTKTFSEYHERLSPAKIHSGAFTMTHRIWSSAIVLAMIAAWPASPQKNEGPSLTNTCLITGNVKRLIDFYEQVLALKAKTPSSDYAEFVTGVGVLAIFSAKAQEDYIPGSAEAAMNKSMILEFRVSDVDAEYRRLHGLVKTWVKPPTTQPWGTRSVYFRDPDGNLVNFYSPPKSR